MSKNSRIAIILIIFGLFAALIITGLDYALGPLLFAFFLAYLVFPAISKLEKHGLNRIAAVSIIFTLLLAVITAFVMAFVPWMVKEGGRFFSELPDNVTKAVNVAEKLTDRIGLRFFGENNNLKEFLRDQVGALSEDAASRLASAVSGVFSNVAKWIIALLNVLLLPLFFYFFIMDYEKIKDEIKGYIPGKYMALAREYAGRANRILSGYIRGKLVVAFILGLLYGAGLHLIGLQYGFLIGFVSGILSILPYVGSLLGFAAAIIMGLADYQGIFLLIGIVAIFSAAQVLENYVITPRLVGDSVGLSPFVIILVIIIGGNLMGVIGIFAAIPIAAFLKELLVDLRGYYHRLLAEPVKTTPKRRKKKT